MCDEIGCGADFSHMPPIEIPDADRRAFLAGVAALPLAAVLFDPTLAAAAADGLEEVSVTLSGGQTVKASLAMPAKTPAPAVVLIHEWWGLNDQIKAVAAEYAKQGYVALAVDLYGGGVGTNRDEAMSLMKGLDPAVATETMVVWVDWLKNNDKTTGKVGTVGWCFGGGWSLNTSLATPVDATVIYYGNVAKTADQLASLQSPVLGHFGTLDKNINEEMVGGFEKAMADAGKAGQLTVHWYEANHAFANPSGARYDAEDAALAWTRTLEFLKANLS
ncbi:MAG: dienelactone hydrolase [Hyphomicrobiales bacterium]|nr:MAG: dienelactone hydrolase [Hyphomicrobiales bacterium]